MTNNFNNILNLTKFLIVRYQFKNLLDSFCQLLVIKHDLRVVYQQNIFKLNYLLFRQLSTNNAMDSHLKKPSTNSVGNWTPDEDEIILRYVYEKGKSEEHMMWGNLSETLNGRSGKSCRERWFNHLDPKIKRTEWSQEEQWVLFILRNQTSEKWSLISKKLMGRTDNAVKNYWNSRLKKRIESMQHAVNQHFERKKKQKIAQMTQSSIPDQQASQDQQNSNGKPNPSTLPLAEQVLNLTVEQQSELEAYMERIKSEYLQKILEQVNNQNIEYFENLACEYTLQYQVLVAKQQNNSLLTDKPTTSSDDKQMMPAIQASQENAQTSKIGAIQASGQPCAQIDESKTQIQGQNTLNTTGSDAQKKVPQQKVTDVKMATKNDQRINQDEDEDGEEGCGDESQLPSFMKNPEVIKMHLDILYKSIGFLSEEMIAAKIEQYKQAKEQKKREEEERLQMQIQIKKHRGRSSTQQQNQHNTYQQHSAYHSSTRKERKSQYSGDRDCGDFRQESNGFHKNSQMHSKQFHTFMNYKNRDYQNSTERYERVSGVSTNNGFEMKSKAMRDDNYNSKCIKGQMNQRHSKYERDGFNGRSESTKQRGFSRDFNDQHDGGCSVAGYHQSQYNHNNCINNQKSQCLKIYGHNQSKLQKDGQIITQQQCGSKLTNQPRKSIHEVNGHGNDESFWSSSSFDSCSQVSNNFNRQAAQEVKGKRALDQVLSPKSQKMRRVMKKLWKQKRQYKQMDKIFFSEKVQRQAVAIDPYLPKVVNNDKMSVNTDLKSKQNNHLEAQSVSANILNEDQNLNLKVKDLAKNIASLANGPQEPSIQKLAQVNSGKVTKKGSNNDSVQQKQKLLPSLLKPKKTLMKKLNQKQFGQQTTAQKINDLKQLKLNNRVQQLKKQKLNLAAAHDPNAQHEIHNNQNISQQPPSGMFPLDGTIPAGQTGINPAQFGFGGFPYQTAPIGMDMKPDTFGTMPFGNHGGAVGAPYQHVFGANGFNNGGFQPQGNFMPYGMATNQFNTYQPGTGNTFFHQGCNIHYTDVKTYTTTIHLHCGAVNDPKNGHSDFCKEAQNNMNGNNNGNNNTCQQTMHFTHMLPSHQFISHSNIPCGQNPAFTTTAQPGNPGYNQQIKETPRVNIGLSPFGLNPLPMMFSQTQQIAEQTQGDDQSKAHGETLGDQVNSQSGMEKVQKKGDHQNDFVIGEHEIGGHQRGSVQVNNQSSSYHGSSKTNPKSHSKRYSMRNKRSMMQRNGNSYRTQNFLNQTMTQISKGKGRELNPLYNKKNAALSTHKIMQPIPEYAQVSAQSSAQPAGQQDRSMIISPEVVKRHKNTEESSQDKQASQMYQADKQIVQNTPITCKNQNIYQSPGPSQSFARYHAMYGQTPNATPQIGTSAPPCQSMTSHSAFKLNPATSQFAPPSLQTDHKKAIKPNHASLNMTAKTNASTVASALTMSLPQKQGAYTRDSGPSDGLHLSGCQQPAQIPGRGFVNMDKFQPNQNTNEYSSDILMRVKSGNQKQGAACGHQVDAQAAQVAQGGFNLHSNSAGCSDQVPVVSAFQF